MERVKERAQIARKALSTLQELTNQPNLSLVERDAAIQRFEYTFEAAWKTAQLFLAEVEGLTANSPKSVIRACWQAGLFDESTAQLALQMCEARNMTVHTYSKRTPRLKAGALSLNPKVRDHWQVYNCPVSPKAVA
jgi:nucleotidyltransferase substrate binding protein (TIGR01987 family)